MGPTLILTVAMALPMGGGHGHTPKACHHTRHNCRACDTCQHGNGCGHHGCNIGQGFWARQGLPAPCHAPGNMMQHLPYHTEDMRYYYFRPYNHMHIPIQQAEAVSVGIPYSQPYSNAIFQRVYTEVEAQWAPEQVPAPDEQVPPPPVPPAPDSPLAPPSPDDSPLDYNVSTGTSLSIIP